MSKKKTFKAVDWVRKIRDENNKRYPDSGVKGFAEKLSKEARNSKLWKDIKSKKVKLK